MEFPKLTFKKITVRELDAPKAAGASRFVEPPVSQDGTGTGTGNLCCA